MAKNLTIKEDITDWYNETLEKGIIIQNNQDILNLVSAGVSTAMIARAIIVNRELGEAPPDIVRSNKLLMTVGAMKDVSTLVMSQRHEVVTPSGRTFMSGDYLGKGKIKEGEDIPSYVEVQSENGLKNAENYLGRVIPGHVWNRLLNIIDAGGDVEPHAETLKRRIDDMVERILEPNGE